TRTSSVRNGECNDDRDRREKPLPAPFLGAAVGARGFKVLANGNRSALHRPPWWPGRTRGRNAPSFESRVWPARPADASLFGWIVHNRIFRPLRTRPPSPRRGLKRSMLEPKAQPPTFSLLTIFGRKSCVSEGAGAVWCAGVAATPTEIRSL